MSVNNQDISHHAFELLNTCSSWMHERHQWLIHNMRCILTGESPPDYNDLVEFDHTVEMLSMHMPHHLQDAFREIKNTLEQAWTETIKTSHPVSGDSVFDQLNQFQHKAHVFMQLTKDANEQLWHEFAMRDTLTGAWTRLKLNACLSDELERAKRYEIPCTIALLDQNDFKKINDDHGHVVGDKLLAESATIIQKNLRPNDKLFRYGGDEWLIIMPSTTEYDAKISIDRIQKLYANHAFQGTDEAIQTEFSYGLSSAKHQHTVEDWVHNADNQLYINKLKFKKLG